MDEYVHKKIDKIEFGFMSPKAIKEMASAKIVTPELYDKEGYPVDGGLMDIRLGVIDPGLKCKTCGGKLKECPGHFGYIELARPVIHIKFVSLIYDLLRCTCRDCGRILIPKQRIDKALTDLDQAEIEGGLVARRDKIKEMIVELKTINQCPYCKSKQFKITLEKPSTFLEDEKKLSPIEIRMRLEKIPDEDLKVFGINPNALRPEWTILTVMPIPSVTMRPSITLESGERSEDDLTHKLGDIVRINQRLFENINAGAPEIIIEDLWDLLQYHITTFFDNEVSQLPPARHRSGQPLKTLTSRIKSKEGRIRHNLAGKRVNFSARTVISPDPRLEINEVGVPKVIAMKLTVPERVTQWNMDYLKAFVTRGPDNYPGANYVIRPDGKRKRITNETKEQLLEEIQPGFIVERHLMDGDIAVFNRQPSLHRMSMMCHKVRVLPGLTFRLNPSVCEPYNADFDGDEMNLHIPQTEEARAEAEILMHVPTQIISPRYGLSIIGCSKDSQTGMYILSEKNFKLTREEAIDLLSAIGITDYSRLPDKEIVSGRDVISVLLPKDFNFIGYSKIYKENKEDPDAVVRIEKGVLKSGVLDNANLGKGQGLLLRNIYKQYGPDFASDFLGKIFKLGNAVLSYTGFTTGIADIDISPETKAQVMQILEQTYQEVEQLIKEYNEGRLETLPGRSMKETLELKILEKLNKARNKSGKIAADNAKKDSELMLMIKSGGAGNLLNLAQMSACVGQQSMRGGRISKGFSKRTLSVFKKNDLGPAARGFIKEGFKDGLKPHELFFMSMTGRDSLMDTALRTPKSGYLYRRLANAMQDLRISNDFTVRDASNKIIQFVYGEDGVDVTKSENGRINVKRIIESVMSEN
ncbi:MAG: DNA-directed RNA polymerase subunit A' [Candidatus Woesearchaeota archaeon]|nr:MAG: DNA-directed RNA polymerase subunit A' [Candidatus Woesearchaeota archaeon]